jgi:putative heme-binding domain-containing protein
MKSFLVSVATVSMLVAYANTPPSVAAAFGRPQSQEVFTSSELDYAEGGALYRNRCMGCHGPDGDRIDGLDVANSSVSLPNADLIRTIIGGVRDSSMSPSGLTAFEAGTVAAYLRFISSDRITAIEGDAARGQALIEARGGCLDCHTILGRGALIAPDLTGIGNLRRSAELRDSLLDPNSEVRTENRFVIAHLANGETVRGRLLNQDSFSVQILTTEERLRAVSKATLDELEFTDSPMPSFRDSLTSQELNDIVRFLVSLQLN